MRETSFQTNKVIGNCGWGKTWRAHSFPPPKSLDLSFDCLVFLFMLLFDCLILTHMNDLYQRENQVFKPNSLFVLLLCYIVGKYWAGPFFPPSTIFQSFYLSSVFWIMLLFHPIWTLMNDLFQREDEVFKRSSLLVLLHYRVGKDWGGPLFPPSKIFRSFYLSFSLLDYATLSSYLNTYE